MDVDSDGVVGWVGRFGFGFRSGFVMGFAMNGSAGPGGRLWGFGCS